MIFVHADVQQRMWVQIAGHVDGNVLDLEAIETRLRHEPGGIVRTVIEAATSDAAARRAGQNEFVDHEDWRSAVPAFHTFAPR